MSATISVCIFSFIFVSFASADGPYSYKEDYFDQKIDHFNFVKYGDRTFKQRYLYNDTYWNRRQGPVFFYLGNEGDIVNLWKGNVFVLNAAKEFEALVVFAEHRYYGKSLPFGNDSFEGDSIGQLNADQALADYAFFLKSFKMMLKADGRPVIAFGGSYGGMLAAYIRLKYPNLIAGSVAASAPVLQVAGITSGDLYFQQVTKDFRRATPQCEPLVRMGFMELKTWAQLGQQGLDMISKTFHLCHKLEEKDYDHFLRWLRNAFVNAAQMDYPYESGSLPANPVKVMCKYLQSSPSPPEGLYRLSAVFYNSTKDLDCFDIYDGFVFCADQTGCGNGFDGVAWDYQACTEMNLEASSNGVQDMFPVLPFTPSMRDEYCYKTFKVVPRREVMKVVYWGEDLSSSSNIVFSNGNLDPWGPGGVLKNISNSVVAVIIDGGAHHLDFKDNNPNDPQSVKDARMFEKRNIQKWIREYYDAQECRK